MTVMNALLLAIAIAGALLLVNFVALRPLWKITAPRLFDALAKTDAFELWYASQHTVELGSNDDAAFPRRGRGDDRANMSGRHLNEQHVIAPIGGEGAEPTADGDPYPPGPGLEIRPTDVAEKPDLEMGGLPMPSVSTLESEVDEQARDMPRRLTPELQFLPGGYSTRGLRSENQDAWHATSRFGALADGVGGRPEGRTAAHTAIAAARNSVDLLSANGEQDLFESSAIADTALREKGETVSRFRGMSTTLDLVGLFSGTLSGSHVGDARVYLQRPGERLRLLTEDQTDQRRNRLHQAVGHPDGRPTPQTWSVSARPGDRVVMLSDGVWQFLTANPSRTSSASRLEKALSLADKKHPDEAARILVGEALDAGSDDNATAVVLDIVSDNSAE